MSYKKIFWLLPLFVWFNLTANDSRPKVLIIGDQIYNEPARAAATALKDKAHVEFWKFGSYNSTSTLADFEAIMQGKKWDLIHFNFGLNDLMYADPATKEVRALHKEAGGEQACSTEQYAKNLEELIKRFRATGAKLVWANTTPIVGSNGILYAGDEIKYNKVAESVMNRHKVTINDMHKVGLAAHKSMGRNGKTYSYKGSKVPLHLPIVKVIIKELNLIKPVKGPLKVYFMIGDNTTVGQGMVADTRKPRKGRPGTLDELVLNPATASQYKHLISNGTWAKRSDVWFRWVQRNSGYLTIGYGERNNNFGPEYGFGQLIGNQFDQQVYIVKPYMKNSILADKNFFKKDHSHYKNLLSQLKQSLTDIQAYFPDYTQKTGCDISGVVVAYNQGEKDLSLYADNLSKLISSLRKDLGKASLPVVILGAGQGGKANTKLNPLIKIQQSTARTLAKTTFVDTRPFWPDKAKSPDKSPERWHGNAESFYKMGETAAKELLKLK